MSKRISVVYLIENICTGKGYVGSAKRGLADRKYTHLRQLVAGNHHSILLQRAWDKYGEDCFRWIVLEKVRDADKLIEREQFWLDKLQTFKKRRGYNIAKIAGSNAGCEFYQSEGFKQKMRDNMKRMWREGLLSGSPHSVEWRVNQGKTQAKLTQEQADEIRRRLKSGDLQKKIAQDFGVCQQTISNISRKFGIVYGGFSREEVKQKRRSRITESDRERVRAMYSQGMTQVEIVGKTGFSQSVISNIVRS